MLGLKIKKKMDTRKHREIQDVEQAKRVVPLITREIAFGQHVRKLFFGVNMFDFGLWRPN